MDNYTGKSGKRYKINPSKEISRGGEGIIYEISSTSVAKIYHSGIKPITEQKFKLLSVLTLDNFVIPEDILLDSNGNSVGYVMKIVDKDHFPLYTSFAQSFCIRMGLNDTWKIEISKKIVSCTKFAHTANIVIGDLSGFNILIDKQSSVKFIDTDSYEVKGFPHSGRLLEEIRDYKKGGSVCKDSDYFALSVLIFNLLTGVHPFKGVHKKYDSLSERMIRSLPVTVKDSNLIIPKCYRPISDKFLLDQFHKIFVKGERFPIELDNKMVLFIQPSVKVINTQDQLSILNILENSPVRYIQCSSTIGVVYVDNVAKVYDFRYKGYWNLLHTVNIDEKTRIFVSDNKVFKYDGRYMYDITIQGKETRMKNFDISDPLSIYQYENIIVFICENEIQQVNIEMVNGENVMIKTISAYGKSFVNHNGLFQKVSGTNFIFYHEKTMNFVRFPDKLIDLYQSGKVGSAMIRQQNTNTFVIFVMEGLNCKVYPTNYDRLRRLALSVDKKFIAIPENDSMDIRRIEDMSSVGKYDIKGIHEESSIFWTKAGIVVHTDDSVFLMNRK